MDRGEQRCELAPQLSVGTALRERIDCTCHSSHSSSVMDPPPPLSKSAQKKAAREARFTEVKLQRRAREKEAKKEKKRVRAELRAAGELDEEDQARKKKRPRVQFGGKVVVDLGFDDLMSEKVSFVPCLRTHIHMMNPACSGSQITLLPISLHLQRKSSRIVPLFSVIYFSRG